MNSKLKLALMTAALLTFIAGGTRMALSNTRTQRTAQAHAKKTAPSATAGSKASPAYDCSLLTPAMIQKVLGRRFQGNPEAQKAPPMYGGAWGWSCTYDVGSEDGAMDIDFGVYEEASAAKAKQDFDTLSIGADSSAGRPSIGDSSYWFTNDKQEPRIWVLKGKVRFSIGINRGIVANAKQLQQTKDLAASIAVRI